MNVRTDPVALLPTHVNIDDAYALNVWARYFNAPESAVKQAVQTVGADPLRVREQLENLDNATTETS